MTPHKVKTPCVGTCSTSVGDEVCRGCGRTWKEVVEWNGYTDAQKLEVLKLIEERKNERD